MNLSGWRTRGKDNEGEIYSFFYLVYQFIVSKLFGIEIKFQLNVVQGSQIEFQPNSSEEFAKEMRREETAIGWGLYINFVTFKFFL